MGSILNSGKYVCSCGKVHTVKTKIISGKNIIKDVGTNIKDVFLSGNIAVCTAESVAKTGCIVQDLLHKNGFTVRAVTINNDDKFNISDAEQVLKIPECVRFLVGIGSGSVADIVRFIANKNKIGYALVVTAPSTDSFLSSYVYDSESGKKIVCNSPDMIFIDEDIIDKTPNNLVASGYGRVVAQIVNIFDMQYNKFITSKKPCDEVLAELAKEIHQFECNKENPNFKNRLMELLIKISYANEFLESGYTAVDCFARLLGKYSTGRTEGENSMLSGHIILNLYKCYLKTNVKDMILPPDIIKSVKLLEKSGVINYNDFIKSFNITTVDDYLKQTFILSEYRRDLFALINDIEISELARFWRRIYNDAGYWLRDYLTNNQLMRYLSLSAEMSQGCLINHIKRIGFLENYI